MHSRTENFVEFLNCTLVLLNRSIRWGRVTVSSVGTLAICLAVLVAGQGRAAGQQAKATPEPAKPAAATTQQKASQPSAAEENSPSNTITGSGTANTIPVFTGSRVIHNSQITQNGNGIKVNGTVTGVAFTGGGSGLTGVNAATLGGLNSSSFAQVAASNTFTADQTIDGNLNLTGSIDSTLILQGNLTDQYGQEGANVIGGFAGNAQYPGNSIAPGVIGGTIGGGGGAYNADLIPRHPAFKHPLRGKMLGRPASRRPFSTSRNGVPESADRSEAAESAPPNGGLTQGNNVIPCCPSWATIAGGLRNTASGGFSTVSGGFFNMASGLESTVSGGEGNTASDVQSTVGGGSNNTASGFGDGEGSATVAGGDSNNAPADDSTVAGGVRNTASDVYSAVGGGANNTASGDGDYQGAATVGGGQSNQATGDFSTVAGGNYNIASGDFSTVAGGLSNQAKGIGSFAAGCNATATYYDSFVWGDNCSVTTQDTNNDQLVARAFGGFFFLTDSSQGMTGTGATLPAGSGSWSSLSDRNVKANFLSVDTASLLEKLAAMPIATWNYKSQAESIRHLGPTAQDFHEAFGLGEDDKHISTVDAQGVALAGIQALYQTVTGLKQSLAETQQSLAELQQSLAEKDREIVELRSHVERLEQSAGTQ